MHLTNWWQRRRQCDGATYQARDVHHAIKVNGVLNQSTKQEGFIHPLNYYHYTYSDRNLANMMKY